MDNVYVSDWRTYKFGMSLAKTKNGPFSQSCSEHCTSSFSKINNSGTINNLSSGVRNKVLSDITHSVLNTNSRQISHNDQIHNSEIAINSSITRNQTASEEKFSIYGETQISRVSPINLSYHLKNESSSSSSASDGNTSFSEDDTLLELISQGSFSIDPKKITSHETDSLLNTQYGTPNYKLPCNSNLRKNSRETKRKLEFSSNLNTTLKRSKTTKSIFPKNNYHVDSKQSLVNDYFNIKKFPKNESLNNFTNINSPALSISEEPTTVKHFNISMDNNNEQTSEQSSIFNLDDAENMLNLKKKSQEIQRKFVVSSNLKNSKVTKLKLYEEDSKAKNNQSCSNDYFNSEKFPQNESQNNLTNINSLSLSHFEEAITFNHFNISNNEQTSRNDRRLESKQSSLCNFDDKQNQLSESEIKINKKMLKISKKTSLIYTGQKVVFDDKAKKKKNLQIMAKIQEIFLNFTSSLKKADENNSSHTETMQSDGICEPGLTIKFGNKGRQRSSSLKIFLLGKIYSLIAHNEQCSQRQVYYELKKYVTSPSMIANTLFSICLLLNVEPWYLPINSSGEGLVFGNLTIITSNNIIINCLNFGGSLIPQDVLQIKEFKSDAIFILIVENDATFKKLLDEDISKTLATSCIVITGKGFPDYNTRLFSKLLWRHLRIPIFILTDGDPFGIEIMLTYRFGSKTRPHFLEDIAIPEIQWIGILPSDIVALSIPHEELNQADIAKVKKMLERPYVQKYDWLKRELECMLKCNKKAGIEGVLDNYRSLTKFYLASKLFSTDFY